MKDDEINFTRLFLRETASDGRQKSGSGLNQPSQGGRWDCTQEKPGHCGRDLCNLCFSVYPIVLPQCCRKGRGLQSLGVVFAMEEMMEQPEVLESHHQRWHKLGAFPTSRHGVGTFHLFKSHGDVGHRQ